jgi:hypothetical protein
MFISPTMMAYLDFVLAIIGFLGIMAVLTIAIIKTCRPD